MVFVIQAIVVFRFILSISIAAEGSFKGRQDSTHYVTNNPQLLSRNFRKKKKVSLFLQKPTKNLLFVKTTASPITTIRRVLYPLVNITLYYLEKLRNCYINGIHFVSPSTRGLSLYPVQVPIQRKNYCKEWKRV